MENGYGPIETADRLARIETKLDSLLVHKESTDEKVEGFLEFQRTMNQKIAWIGAAFGIVFTGVGYAFQFILSHLSFKIDS